MRGLLTKLLTTITTNYTRAHFPTVRVVYLLIGTKHDVVDTRSFLSSTGCCSPTIVCLSPVRNTELRLGVARGGALSAGGRQPGRSAHISHRRESLLVIIIIIVKSQAGVGGRRYGRRKNNWRPSDDNTIHVCVCVLPAPYRSSKRPRALTYPSRRRQSGKRPRGPTRRTRHCVWLHFADQTDSTTMPRLPDANDEIQRRWTAVQHHHQPNIRWFQQQQQQQLLHHHHYHFNDSYGGYDGKTN